MNKNKNFGNQKTKAVKKNKPWRDERGNLRSDDELRDLATQWAPSTWEAYLKDIGMGESVESSPEDEVLFAHPSREDIFSTENTLKEFVSELKIEYFPMLGKAFRKAIANLSERQHEILVLHFWKGLNQYEIAAQLGISQSAVSQQLVKVLSIIRAEIFQDFGGSKKSSQTNANLSAEKATRMHSAT
jgi:RNA polymerase sigma factor (sigma-70 family)